MNYRLENKHHRKENAPENIQSTMQKVNANVAIDEHLKRRTRGGGYVAWPGREPSGSSEENRKPGAP